MSLVDKRGGRVDYKLVPQTGFFETYIIEDSDQTAVDITGYSFELSLVDGPRQDVYDRSSQPSTKKTFNGSITDAANGTFTVTIPAGEFSKLWGDQLTYSISMTPTAQSAKPLVWGVLTIEELR